jgi:hypothetical protein
MTRYPLYRSGSKGRSGRLRKISTPPGFHPRTVQAIASRSLLYHLRYLGRFCTRLSAFYVGSTQVFIQMLFLRIACTVGCATTNECYNEQFLSIKLGYYNEHRCYNERGGILSADVARTCDDVSGLPTFIRAAVIIFVIVCKLQLSVQLSAYL